MITVKRDSDWLYQETDLHIFSVKLCLYYLNKRQVQKKITENELTVNDLKITCMHTHTFFWLLRKTIQRKASTILTMFSLHLRY